MKKILFLLFVIISFASFGQVPDTSRAKKVYGNMIWVKYDTTAATWDTLGIFPGATPELWSSSGLNHTFIDTGYVKTTGDTIHGNYWFNGDSKVLFGQSGGFNNAASKSTYIHKDTLRITSDYAEFTVPNCTAFVYTELTSGCLKFYNGWDDTEQFRISARHDCYEQDTIVSGNGLIINSPTTTIDGNLIVNGLYYQSDITNLVNGDSIVLTNGISGWGEVYAFNAGAIDEWAEFIISSDGAVYLKSNSTDVVNTDTADKLCIFDNGSGVTIRNRLGGTRIIKYIIHH